MGAVEPVVQVDLLGEVRVRVAGGELAVGPPRQRAVLAVLALRAGATVSRSELIDGVWGESAPASVEGSVHTYIHGLRRVLSATGGEMLVRTGAGYRLVLEPAAVDVTAVELGVRRARELAGTGENAAAVRVLDECLGLWRGVPLAGVPGPLAEAERVRLTELRYQLVEERADLMLALRRHRELVAELGEAVLAEPFRERLRALLMLALYRSGRRAEALAEFDTARRLLVAELGLDPGAELAELHARILRADPELEAPITRPASVAPAQLPHEVADFVGRSHELAQLEEWNAAVGTRGRALIISAVDGFGGVGKTSLAVRFARQVAKFYPDGQLYLNLRGFDPHRTPLTVQEALAQLLWSLGAGGRRQELDAQVAIYRTLLSDKQMLILLDNAASAEQVRELLPGPSNSLVLVTSRNRLSGLVVREGAHRLTLGLLSEAEAIQLLRASVGGRRVGSEPEQAAALARLCGYLPLALRIAAEKISSDPEASLQDLVENLTVERDRLDALDVGDDDMSSVRAVFSWSYHSLDPEVARAFRYLGVLPGQDIGVEAAAAALDRSPGEAAKLLAVLCEQNLLEREGDRYGFHDLVRVYAAELGDHVDSADERSAASRRLLSWYVYTLRAAYSCIMPHDRIFPLDLPEVVHELPVFATGDDAYAWCQLEAANIRALMQCAAELGEHEAAWQMAWYMYNHYYSAGLVTEWLEVLRIALRSAEQRDGVVPRLRILNHISIANSRLGRNDIAARTLEEALAIAGGTDNDSLRIGLLVNLSSTLREAKQYDQGIVRAREGVQLALKVGGPYEKAGSFDALCELYVESQRPAEALECGRAGLDAARAAGNDLLAANILVNLGHAHRDLGNMADAVAEYETALELCVRLGDRYHEALARFGMAELHRRNSRFVEAREQARRALDIFLRLDGEEAGVAQAFLASLEDVSTAGSS
ncbi:BTAD domain-containing putative transcriptional regulator [Amycolatopsis sp. lyj-23]|uniref:AfsR/SARP family transcriptional regulator n=1 Tax=Amycolatopsis sp. lyj-23 TaxID=2789283 RepID=UPI003978C9E4